jgi:ankyrin repeat protein
MSREYQQLMELLASGTAEQLEALSHEVPGFPHGVDNLVNRRWIVNAVGSGSKISVQWMLGKGVDLNFRDEEGYTPLHVAIERNASDRYEMLELLLRAGAPINLKGINDWTPAHMAAARDDVEALKILVHYGADLSIRTDIDDYATPLEEARNLGKVNAARYLESVV